MSEIKIQNIQMNYDQYGNTIDSLVIYMSFQRVHVISKKYSIHINLPTRCMQYTAQKPSLNFKLYVKMKSSSEMVASYFLLIHVLIWLISFLESYLAVITWLWRNRWFEDDLWYHQYAQFYEQRKDPGCA